MAHEHHYNEGHRHSHIHAPTAIQAGSRAFIIGIALNLDCVIAETVSGLWTHSLAYAGHNLSGAASCPLLQGRA